MTELDTKLSNSATQSITTNVLTAKSAVITDNKPFSHVSTTVSNSASNGYASVFVKSLNSSNIELEAMGLRIGNNTGATIMTTTNTPLTFSTYAADVDMTYNRPSIEINSSGTRDVTNFLQC